MSAQVSEAATTVTEATAVGARPVRASTRWSPRCAVPEVATAPVNTGTTARTRVGSAGSSIPIRHGGPAGSRGGQGMSPPAGREKTGSGGVEGAAGHVATGREAEVGVRQRAERRGGALDRPALDHSAGIQEKGPV